MLSPQDQNKQRRKAASQSIVGLNAINFFQAEMVGVVMPLIGVFLREHRWHYEAIGVATAAAGLGTLVLQTPAGVLTDRVSSRRLLFAAAAILTGACYTTIPFLPNSHGLVDAFLFISGATQSFFPPLLGALALALVGHELLNKMAGQNQGWNHAGNIAAAVAAMGLVRLFNVSAVFYAVGACSLLAAISVLLIRADDLDEEIATGLTLGNCQMVSTKELFRDRSVLALVIAIFLFHLANAPILPTTALYVKKLGGSDSLMTATVLSAQTVMVPVSLLAGRYGDRWGRKPVMAIAFWFLPLRILSYTLVSNPKAVVWLQALDGIGAGIYGVVVISLAADLTRGKGGFNTLAGLFATALATGGVFGPLISGFLLEHIGFKGTFSTFAALALIGAAVFSVFVPETKGEEASLQQPELAA
ncbi:MAG: MFS transporter [Acidobacteriaceae bacterium]|nr:MFS transporter [Acidobacteriaceae bacterium]